MAGHESLWTKTALRPSYPAYTSGENPVDVAIVGAGITGLTAAVLLVNAGKTVAVLEARHVGAGVTARTSAHLTAVLDTRYHQLERDFGRDGAKLAAESSLGAIAQIEELVLRSGMDAEFERVPGYLFAEKAGQVAELEREQAALSRAGIEAQRGEAPLPFPVRAALRVPGQAQFHPLKYLSGLADRVERSGSRIYERSRALSIDEGEPSRVHLENGASLCAERVILATHTPLNAVLLQPRLAQYRSYVVSGPVERAPAGLFWDLEDPYHYVRSRGAELIVGGADHKTGQASAEESAFDEISAFAARFGLAGPAERWSAQVVEPVDGLPLIGADLFAERVYIATGFSGNGLTFGTLAAQILSDACLGRSNPFAELYSVRRLKPLASLRSLLGENVDFPLHLLSDRVRPPDVRDVNAIPPGDGKIVRVNGERLAVYRDDAGRLHAVSPICTHLGCHVAFNAAERTWDCPCHGSRFDTGGAVLDGPATRPLARKDV